MRATHPAYHAAPVPAFGPANARLLVVGLAPGMHGANASGRPFTGDHAGVLLYQTLFDHGFSSAPVSLSADDGLQLYDCRITNAVKCLPPDNKPVAAEVNRCNAFLRPELVAAGVLIVLGGVAHKAVIRALGLRQIDYPFGHEAEHRLPDGQVMIDSYHCSRYNTNTRRLTATMFANVFARAQQRVNDDLLP
ncbi:uracil-DNA glycosylase [Salinisphaera aquimarina]